MRTFQRLFIAWMACLLMGADFMMAQEAEVQRLAGRNRDMQTLTASVVRTKHNAAIAEDQVEKGTFYLQKPGQMALVFLDGEDKLVMDGETYTMVNNGKASQAKGPVKFQFAVLQAVLKNVLADGEFTELGEQAETKIERQDQTIILTVTPTVVSAKAKRRMMFQSFVLTLDTRTSRIQSLRMNERGTNYTQYDFVDYQPDSTIDKQVFIP